MNPQTIQAIGYCLAGIAAVLSALGVGANRQRVSLWLSEKIVLIRRVIFLETELNQQKIVAAAIRTEADAWRRAAEGNSAMRHQFEEFAARNERIEKRFAAAVSFLISLRSHQLVLEEILRNKGIEIPHGPAVPDSLREDLDECETPQ